MKRMFIPILLITLILAGTACALLAPSPAKMTRRALSAHKQYDAIIVPGYPFTEPTWNQIIQMRLIWAKYLYDKGVTRYIVTSGSAVYTPYVEARIMAEYLVAMGVPREHILLEERAEHSTENLWYGYQLARRNGLDTVALCTDPFQTRMLYHFARRKTGRKIRFLPVIFDTLRGLPHDTPVIAYRELKIDSFIPITERESRWKRFKGTMGQNINYKE
jgi:uncharacterized SAM-binding protein YcdF (DUF218 family)